MALDATWGTWEAILEAEGLRCVLTREERLSSRKMKQAKPEELAGLAHLELTVP